MHLLDGTAAQRDGLILCGSLKTLDRVNIHLIQENVRSLQHSIQKIRNRPMSTKPTQFCLSHAKDAVFQPMKGLRDWLETRDLGLVEATNGHYEAWIS